MTEKLRDDIKHPFMTKSPVNLRTQGKGRRRAKERARRKRGEGSRWIEKGKTSLEQGFRRPLAPERKEVVEKADGREKVREVPGGSREDRADRPTREGSSGQDASERDQGQLSGGVTMKDRSQKVKDAEEEREKVQCIIGFKGLMSKYKIPSKWVFLM